MSNFEKNNYYNVADDELDYSDNIVLLENDYPGLDFTKIGGASPFNALGLYGDLDFYFQYNHGVAELTVGVKAKGKIVPDSRYHAEIKYATSGVVPDEGEFEDMFARLMDVLLAENPDFDAEV